MSEFLFTVVMAVYNAEAYLEEAVDSLLRQDIGFEHVQLILSDDGSTDQSGVLCDQYARRYPQNILALHQDNAGVSSARNAALSHVKGKYVNFLDSDDCLSENTLSLVRSFFEIYDEQTDVAAIPIFYFENRTGPHRLNYKFDRGTRLIDLNEEWDAIQLSMSSAFVRRECLDGLAFHTELCYGEDSALLLKILQGKQTLGVIAEAKYLYRQRAHGEASALQRSVNDPRYYLPKLKHLTEATIADCRRRGVEIPKFVQFSLMYDLQWVFQKEKFPAGILTPQEEQEYLARVFNILPLFDDEMITRQRHISKEIQYFLLKKKWGTDPRPHITGTDLELYFGRQCVGRLSEGKIDMDFIHITEDSMTMEGYFMFYPQESVTVSVCAEQNGSPVQCEQILDLRTRKAFGEDLMTLYGFRLTIPLRGEKEKRCIRVGVTAGQSKIFLPIRYGWYSPISDRFSHNYYIYNKWCLQAADKHIEIMPATRFERQKRECRYLAELFFGQKNHRRKAALIRMLYWLSKPWQRKPVWLVSDRRTRAADNGEAFFRYLRREHPEIDARFVLRKDSAAFSELKKLGKVVENDTIGEQLSALLSDCMVSSQAEAQYLNPLYKHRDVFRDLMADKRFVFLQHGIIKDDLSSWLMRPNKNFYGFVTSTEPEYLSIINGHYGYSEKEIWLTGLPRYDLLENGKEAKIITIMPTWRRFLMEEQDPETMAYPLKKGFQKSSFFNFYNDLLNDRRLLSEAKKHGYRIAFLPHPTLQPHLDLFDRNEDVCFLGLETDYKDIFRESAMVVTDYSSAVFDAVYLYKPVVYAQFDKEAFFAGEHIYRKGYFDYERDGFGEVEYTYENTVKRIIEYINTGCLMKPVYRERADRFFAFRDQKNCQRVYDKIMEKRQ